MRGAASRTYCISELPALSPCGFCLERETREPVTVVNGVGPGGNGLSGNPGSATDFLVHIRFIHMDFPHLQNGLCRLTEIVLGRCIVPTQDGYYYIVVVECPVSTNGLLDVTQ